MSMLGRIAGLAAAPAVLAVGLVGPATRAVRGSVGLVRTAAVGTARVAGTVLTGSDPVPEVSPRGLVDVAKGMVEPPM